MGSQPGPIMELTAVLQAAQSPDAAQRTQAEQQLQSCRETNHGGFVASLAEEVGSEAKPIDTRRLAGLILKNELDAKDEARKTTLTQKWLELDPALKKQIKDKLLLSLGAQLTEVGRVAAQVIAKVAAIEVPRHLWPELVQTLLVNMANTQHPHLQSLKLCTLECLGYICEELAENPDESGLDQAQVNSILTAVVQGMHKGEPNADVRFAATCALLNTVEFASENFEKEAEQKYIMQVIMEGTQSPDSRTRKASFECIVVIAAAYYPKLPPYMTDLFVISTKAIREDEEPVALQALEVWCTIAEEEIELLEEDADETAATSGGGCHNITRQAAPHLAPVLLETLTKQEEGELGDEGAWGIAIAGGTCLGLLANCLENDAVALVWPYVQENIGKPDWRFREAATMAFGSILEGPDSATLAPLVNMALSFLLNAMNDSNLQVRDTTAWTIGRICQELHGSHVTHPVITPQNLPTVVGVMLQSMDTEPAIVEKVCYVFHNLAEGYEDVEGDSSPLSPFFQSIVSALLEVANRPVVGSSKLRYHAYESLNEVIRCSTKDTASMVLQLIPLMMGKLQETLAMSVQTPEEREKQNELQGLLCGVLQVIIQKLSSIDNEATKANLMGQADQLMTLFLQVFACRSATVHEEALLAVGGLVNAMGLDFHKYMQAFFPYIETGLQNFQEYQVCTYTVEVVGDLCRALGPAMAPFCDKVMYLLLNDLQAGGLHRSVKPSILSCFGDIALAIEGAFEKYLPFALPMLQSAAALSIQTQVQLQQDDEDTADYNNALRNGILEAYSGFFQGFKQHRQHLNSDMVQSSIRDIVTFIEKIYEDPTRDARVTKNALWVLGDLADTIDNCGPIFAERQFYHKFLQECGKDKGMKETAQWTMERISARLQ